MAIPFVREIDFEYGKVEQVSPLLRRVIANNPGPFTFVGTGVYIVGKGEVAVIDPGPYDEVHFEALKEALKGETVKYVLVTHGHSDHSPLARPLAEWAGCKVYAKDCGKPTAKGELGSEDDVGFSPDELVKDGDLFSGPGWTLEVIETPGHTCSHICFDLKEENACLSGDHIMGWSTTIVAPPDGDMADYFKSLNKIEDRNFETLWPTHGSPIETKAFVKEFIQAYRQHRQQREDGVIAQMQAGNTDIKEMVKVMYIGLEERLFPAACLSLLGHMGKLIAEGRVTCDDEMPVVQSNFQLVEVTA
ncbi:MAG: MBL fold metallo-hydrolase [Henriciella sp.]|jgi:glyoxylase-like metal-dependent hydrolase (beta-lactamase superfamily II)